MHTHVGHSAGREGLREFLRVSLFVTLAYIVSAGCCRYSCPSLALLSEGRPQLSDFSRCCCALRRLSAVAPAQFYSDIRLSPRGVLAALVNAASLWQFRS